MTDLLTHMLSLGAKQAVELSPLGVRKEVDVAINSTVMTEMPSV